MGYNYNQIITPGVEHGPYPLIRPGVYALGGIDISNGRDAEMERENGYDSIVKAIETAWDEGRISSEEADERLMLLLTES